MVGFIIYFAAANAVGNAPISLAIIEAKFLTRKLHGARECAAIGIMLFFALCRTRTFCYANIREGGCKIAGGIILGLVALNMLAAVQLLKICES